MYCDLKFDYKFDLTKYSELYCVKSSVTSKVCFFISISDAVELNMTVFLFRFSEKLNLLTQSFMYCVLF